MTEISSSHPIYNELHPAPTCEHSGGEPLYPVLPHVEADEGLEAVEGADPDLGHEVAAEVEAGEARLGHELVPPQAAEAVT